MNYDTIMEIGAKISGLEGSLGYSRVAGFR
jgi:hypothetical protein